MDQTHDAGICLLKYIIGQAWVTGKVAWKKGLLATSFSKCNTNDKLKRIRRNRTIKGNLIKYH